MQMKKLVFWDWEETLVSKNLYSNFFLKQVAAKYGKGDIDISSCVNKLSAAEIAQVKSNMLKDIWFIPYAWRLVGKFNEIGIKQAIVSNASSKMLEQNLKKAPFKEFDAVCGADRFKAKPSLEMFDYVIKQTNLSYEDAIFIADSESDYVAAKKANMQFFKVDGSLVSYYKVFEFFNF